MITEIPVKKITVRTRVDRLGQIVFVCGAIATLGGCAERKAHAIPWATAVLVRPIQPVALKTSAAELAELAPDLRVEAPSNPVRLLGTRPVPPRPRGANGSQPEGSNTNGTRAPELVPQLSPQETVVAKVQFAESMAVVERNLAATRQRKLNAAQTDIVSKITGFVAEAREASGEEDWGRARNLAKKAQILSEDLVASL